MGVMKQCPECEGEGTVFYDTSHSCRKPMSDCCGGCGSDIECEDCGGTGEIEDEDDMGTITVFDSINVIQEGLVKFSDFASQDEKNNFIIEFMNFYIKEITKNQEE